MAENDAYIGYRSAGRRPDRNNDRVDALVQALELEFQP